METLESNLSRKWFLDVVELSRRWFLLWESLMTIVLEYYLIIAAVAVIVMLGMYLHRNFRLVSLCTDSTILSQNESCPICLENMCSEIDNAKLMSFFTSYSNQQPMQLRNCRHIFCHSCIQTHLKLGKKCLTQLNIRTEK